MMLPWFFRSWGHGHWCNHSMAEPWYCEPAHKIKFPISSHKHIQYQDFMCHMSPLWPHTFSFRPHHLTDWLSGIGYRENKIVMSQPHFNCHKSKGISHTSCLSKIFQILLCVIWVWWSHRMWHHVPFGSTGQDILFRSGRRQKKESTHCKLHLSIASWQRRWSSCIWGLVIM